MALTETDAALGAPWVRPLHGRFESLVVESEILADNPLGDPCRRPLYVYRAPGAEPGAPIIFMLQGYSGQLDTWVARRAFEPNLVERLDAMFAAREAAPAFVVFVDAWTSRGGSQFLNSAANGRYLDYICDEIVPFVEARHGSSCGRAVLGGSSGGYGAMVLPMLRPDAFHALGSVAGDALFECAYARNFPVVARRLRDSFGGSYQRCLVELERRDTFEWGRFGEALEMYAYACAYSPDPDRPGAALLPFELESGRLVPEVWAQWLEKDPVRMAPRHGEALRSLRAVHLYAGLADDYYLDLAAQAFGAELDALEVRHTLDLYPGTHGSIRVQYPRAVAALTNALAA